MVQAGWGAGQRVPYGYGYGGGEPGGGVRVGWTEDQKSAYLYDEGNNVVGRWIKGRPDISTFDPFSYGYGQGQAAQGGQMYDAWRRDAYGGGAGTRTLESIGGAGVTDEWWHPEGKVAYEEGVRRWELDYAEIVKSREQVQRQHDDWIAQDERRLVQEMEMKRMEIAASTGEIRLQHQLELVEMERQHQYDVQYLQLDWTERHKALDKEIAQLDRAMWSGERLAAAQMGAQPQNYRMYERWLAGLGGQADPSGLPAGAPAFQTGPGMEGAVAGGDVPGVSPYAQAYATGQRIPEFQAWGGSTAPIGGQPWVDPKDVNLAQFSQSPWLSQQMQYGRWRERGLFQEEAQKRMYAAAPTGTAPAQVRYG